MDLDPAVIVPAILFTVVAIYFATSLLSRKPDVSSSSAGSKRSKLGYGDDLLPQGALEEEPEASLRPEPPAPGVEDIGAAETIQVSSIDAVIDQTGLFVCFVFLKKRLLLIDKTHNPGNEL